MQADEAGSSAVDKGTVWRLWASLEQGSEALAGLGGGGWTAAGAGTLQTEIEGPGRQDGAVGQAAREGAGAGGSRHPIAIPRGPRHSVRRGRAGR